MDFKIRYSNIFIVNILLIIVALGMALVSVIYPVFKSGILHYSYVIWALIALIRITVYYKPIYLAFYGKKVLTVNDEFIDDFINGIRYYWKDIKEIYEKNSHLYILLYEPNDYIKDIKNPVKRLVAKLFYISNGDKTPYIINIDLVNVNANVLLELMDDYSIKAESKH